MIEIPRAALNADEIAAEAKDGAENLSDEEYARRLREEGGK